MTRRLRYQRRPGNIAIDVIGIACAQQPSWSERSTELGLRPLALLGTRDEATRVQAFVGSIRVPHWGTVLVNFEPGEQTVERTIVPSAFDAGLQIQTIERRQSSAVHPDRAPVRIEDICIAGVQGILLVDVVDHTYVRRQLGGVSMIFR